MKLRTYGPLLALLLVLLLVARPVHAATLPPLGTAASFGVLAASMVTNTGLTHVGGNVGVSPGTAVTGFPPGTLTGVIHAGDAAALQAQQDVTTAYNNAAGQVCDQNLTGQNLGGLTLIPGVYCFTSAAQLTGQLTLDGQGDPNSVFIFQIGSTLITASNASVLLINGVQPCRVFWQVGSSATLGTTTNFRGNILALASITLNTGTTSNGGLYARTGAVTLDNNQIQSCGPTATPTSTSTPLPPANTPTATLVPPTSTPVPPTSTLMPPTSTPVNTPVPPTSVPPTNPPVNTPEPSATNTALPAATATAIAAATATALATETVLPAVTATAIAAATATALATQTALPAATETAIAAATATAVATETVLPAVTATAIAAATATALATQTALPAATATAIAAATATVLATETTLPTATAPAPATATAEASATTTAVTGGPPLMPPTGGPSDWSSLALALVALLLGLGLAFRRIIAHRAR